MITKKVFLLQLIADPYYNLHYEVLLVVTATVEAPINPKNHLFRSFLKPWFTSLYFSKPVRREAKNENVIRT